MSTGLIKNIFAFRRTVNNAVLLFALLLIGFQSHAQNTNLDSLLNPTQWNSLFPKRAGTFGTHPQGYTTDFYSLSNLKQAAQEMSDYSVRIRIKNGVWGQLITITKKSSGFTYLYSDVESWWHANATPETVILVDFEDFVNRASELNNKRELAAFLANISKETTGGWQLPVGGGTAGDYAQWGLYFVHEVGYNSSNGAGAYSQANAEYPPNPAVGYYGRGPIQLSWNYNYGQFSKFLFNDKNILLNNPDSIQRNGVLAFKSAIWFWMMPQCPKPSCHQAMHELWQATTGEYSSTKMYKKGFAHTNNIINGGLECRSGSTAAFTEKVVLRSELYKFYLDILGLTSAQIAQENTLDYSTLCYVSPTDAMQDYVNCQIISTVGIEKNEIQEVNIYPNPATDFIHIKHSKPIERVEIMNAIGQVLLTSSAHTSQSQLDISSLKAGMYTVSVYAEKAVFTKKIMVIK